MAGLTTLEQMKEVISKQNELYETHIRALACHCECLGFNAANMFACIINVTPPFNESHYEQALKKWGLTDERGEILI